MHRAVLLAEFDQSFQVDAVLVVEPATYFGDTDNFIARLVHQLRCVGADVTESLHDDAGAFAIDAQFSAGLVADDHYAAAGGLAASARTANVDGLSRHDGSNRLAHVHGVGIHHPRHDLFVGIDVGGGNIFLGADEPDQLRSVTAGHALDFAHRHLVRIADHAALRAPEGDVHHGALPGHPARQRSHFVECDVWRVANAALRRTTGDRMLHAEAREDFEMAVIHLHRDVDRQFAVGIAQHAPQAVIEIEFLGGQIKAGALRLPRVALFIHVRSSRQGRHKSLLRNDCGSVPAVFGRFTAIGRQTFRVYEAGWRRSKLSSLRVVSKKAIRLNLKLCVPKQKTERGAFCCRAPPPRIRRRPAVSWELRTAISSL